MKGAASPGVRSHLETLFRAGALAGLSDGQLLDRFVGGRDADAFAALVDRHGPMVRRACRHALGDPHDAEDAAQATFLVLASRARSIRRPESLAAWLHGVACRVAARARLDLARRRAVERRGAERAAGAFEGADRLEGWPELHEELRRLPERFRLPIVLCHLEGLSYAQAARQIGCPVRTVQSRLDRGRARLRDRLVRRGLGPASALLLAALARESAAVAAPVAWTQATVEAALRGVEGPTSGGSAASARLAREVLATLARDDLSRRAAILLLGASACGLAALARRTLPEDVPPGSRGRFRASFSGGATIEVIAVSPHPSGPGTWWRPDGRPLAGPAADPSDVRLDVPGARPFAILARVAGLPEGATLRWLPDHDGDYWGVPPTLGGRPIPGAEMYVASFREGRDACDLDVSLASGRWETLVAHGGAGGFWTTRDGREFYFGKARPSQSGTLIAVAHDLADRDARLVAVDLDGREHLPASSSAGGGRVRLIDVEFPLPPGRIREYRFQSRPFERAEIRAISLRPAE